MKTSERIYRWLLRRYPLFGRDTAQAEADRLTVLLRQARAVGLTPTRAQLM